MWEIRVVENGYIVMPAMDPSRMGIAPRSSDMRVFATKSAVAQWIEKNLDDTLENQRKVKKPNEPL